MTLIELEDYIKKKYGEHILNKEDIDSRYDLKYTPSDVHSWDLIAMNETLTEEFIQKYEFFLYFKLIIQYQKLSGKFLWEHRKYWNNNWSSISKYNRINMLKCKAESMKYPPERLLKELLIIENEFNC